MKTALYRGVCDFEECDISILTFFKLEEHYQSYSNVHKSLPFCSDPEFVNSLQYRFQRVKRADKNIEDVYDGSLYRSKCGPGGFLSEKYNLSVKLNTDGVAIFRSSQFGVWPLFLLINELPPSLRYLNKSKISHIFSAFVYPIYLCVLIKFHVTHLERVHLSKIL